MSFFEEVLNDPKAIEEKILGPSYNYTNNIKTPSEMGMSSKGSLSVLAKDIEGIIAYIELLVSGRGKASKTGKPLGNKFFFKTSATCKDNASGEVVDRYMYIDNVPDGTIPFISEAMGVQMTELEGLIPGALGNLDALNPMKLFQAFQMGGSPPCREITMNTIDVNNVRGKETHFVADADIANMPGCDFPGKKNPVSGAPCREGMGNINDLDKLRFADYDYSKLPEDNIVKIFYASLGIFGVYLLIEFMKRANGKK